jgi:hypothetical protein
MNILEAIVKLRDDLKLWTTNNLIVLSNRVKNNATLINELKDDSQIDEHELISMLEEELGLRVEE